MEHSAIYAVAGSDIVYESFDGDAVVLDLASGRYFGFSDSGSCIWEALVAHVSPSSLIGLSCGQGVVQKDDLAAFVARLLEFGLVVEAVGNPVSSLAAPLVERLAGAKDPLKIEMHDELADLVMVDPIHDVDEPVGWPVVKQ
ncbi:PqqD family protein [Mesorhizobium sp. ANAO-SY3R2]|uniref:PqqD family protein n=1 Tax=Mesorhizobium sp. ANAO-SY3R2 TaxID=3166644 RepID=UPI0036707296